MKLQYKDIVRTNPSRTTMNEPWGYVKHPRDHSLFTPDYEKLYALEKAFEYIEAGATYRDTAKWVKAVTGDYISHVQLFLERKKRQVRYEKARKGISRKRMNKKEQEKLLDAARERASSPN